MFCLATKILTYLPFFYLIIFMTSNCQDALALGSLNFANILFYIRAHQAYSSNPTLVFAGMNIGVIVLGTLVGALAFKEKISTINAAGIVLAVCAIACLFYWPQLARLVNI